MIGFFLIWIHVHYVNTALFSRHPICPSTTLFSRKAWPGTVGDWLIPSVYVDMHIRVNGVIRYVYLVFPSSRMSQYDFVLEKSVAGDSG